MDKRKAERSLSLAWQIENIVKVYIETHISHDMKCVYQFVSISNVSRFLSKTRYNCVSHVIYC